MRELVLLGFPIVVCGAGLLGLALSKRRSKRYIFQRRKGVRSYPQGWDYCSQQSHRRRWR